MSFSKLDLEKIKNKISLSSEIEKKTPIIKKGKDYWCCCLFHKEKTPSCKINDDQNSFYCFGCGAKGDIFTLYTDLYNYSFQESVIELANRAGIKVEYKTYVKKDNVVSDILNASCQWFHNNLNNTSSENCNKYLRSRNLSEQTIQKFKIGFSYNVNSTLFDFLKEKKFNEADIIKSNVVKVNDNKIVKDYFYKRIIFPIEDERGNIVGFGGRSLDNTNPKYINSPESEFFHKRNILYNLYNAKDTIRKKNNLLICEGYMDVISLYQNGIKSVVAPLGTALTEDQLYLSWKYCTKPTIMFDGDKAGLRSSFKSALMSLPLINSKRFLQFITLKEGYDPDSFINNFSFENFLKILKKPEPLVNFIFNESSKSILFDSVDKKVSFDKYLDDLINTIKDNKIKYFYKSEFKSLFFAKLRNNNLKNKEQSPKKLQKSLFDKQILSFIAGAINHSSSRKDAIEHLLDLKIFEDKHIMLLKELQKPYISSLSAEEVISSINDKEIKKIANKCLDSGIYQLFPYSSPDYEANKSLDEIIKFSKNLNTRLLNLQKINKSLDSFISNSNKLNWEELQNINLELVNNDV